MILGKCSETWHKKRVSEGKNQDDGSESQPTHTIDYMEKEDLTSLGQRRTTLSNAAKQVSRSSFLSSSCSASSLCGEEKKDTSSRLTISQTPNPRHVRMVDHLLTQARHRSVRREGQSYWDACQVDDQPCERWYQWSEWREGGMYVSGDDDLWTSSKLFFRPYLDECLYITTFTLQFNLQYKGTQLGGMRNDK